MDSARLFLIYSKGSGGGHAVVYLVRAENLTQAILQFLVDQNSDLKVNEDGSLEEGTDSFPHPLAYIENWDKIYGEWQIRELPEWTLRQSVSEVFCGESVDGPGEIIAICRKELIKQFPRSRPRAFVWYLREGTLVTFYRKRRYHQIEIVQRYLWNWDGHTETLDIWNGDYNQLAAQLDIDLIGP